MHLPKGTVVRRISSVPPSIEGAAAMMKGSGVYEIRWDEALARDARESERVARDEFEGLDRLDREELDDDETPGTTPVGVLHDMRVTHRHRRSA